MSPLARIAVVVVVFFVAVGVGIAGRRGVVVRRHRVRYPGVGAGIVFFASDTCSTCARVEQDLEQIAGGRYRRVSWEADPDTFLRLNIDRVPTLAVVDESGDGWATQGIPNARRLRRWLGDP
jgi:hypothetical protein